VVIKVAQENLEKKEILDRQAQQDPKDQREQMEHKDPKVFKEHKDPKVSKAQQERLVVWYTKTLFQRLLDKNLFSMPPVPLVPRENTSNPGWV
jgi:hypothetical protein